MRVRCRVRDIVYTIALVGAAILFAQPLFAHAPADVSAIVTRDCIDCHGPDAEPGQLRADELLTADISPAVRKHWWKVLKNVRAGVMPPPGNPRPSPAETSQLFRWIKSHVFEIDPERPDPGRLTVRRLNRQEYRNTIRELMGIDFNAEIVFPEDDSGAGFDTVGDALSLSPLLMEKYLRAAEAIVAEAVPQVSRLTPRQTVAPRDFRDPTRGSRGDFLDARKPAQLRHEWNVAQDGEYAVVMNFAMHGSFDFDPSRCQISVIFNGQTLHQHEYGWDEGKLVQLRSHHPLMTGKHLLEVHVEPLASQTPDAKEGEEGNDTHVHASLSTIALEGPLDTNQWQHPPNYQRFFSRPQAPTEPAARRDYAIEVLTRWCRKAFRQVPAPETIDRLVSLCEAAWEVPSNTFEVGIGRAMVAVLASPRFLFRIEQPAAGQAAEAHPLVDELALASRLSYFLWSSMPDSELMDLAEHGRLRSELPQQLKRMLADRRAHEFTSNFIGQWLQTRDVMHVSIDPVAVLGHQAEYDELLPRYRELRSRRGELSSDDVESKRIMSRFRELRELRTLVDDNVRRSMRRETEMSFEYVVRENLSVLELLDANYVFVNEALAKLYDIPDVAGNEMRRVELPAESPRGGVLTQGSMLMVTSNPTRTSPVKRGLFILENILGTPAPPAPPSVPELDSAADQLKGKDPQLREVLALHRASPLCASCHDRMDPLGLALENFTAMGKWRSEEQHQPIDPAGQLISGAKFRNISELKRLLVTDQRLDFYRCLSEKLLTYALGRELDDYDEATVDGIVAKLDAEGGRLSALLTGVVDSAPFQRMRRPPMSPTDPTPNNPAQEHTE